MRTEMVQGYTGSNNSYSNKMAFGLRIKMPADGPTNKLYNYGRIMLNENSDIRKGIKGTLIVKQGKLLITRLFSKKVTEFPLKTIEATTSKAQYVEHEGRVMSNIVSNELVPDVDKARATLLKKK